MVSFSTSIASLCLDRSNRVYWPLCTPPIKCTSITARAEDSVFWPGITSDISNSRQSCYDCNRMAPSQPCSPPYPTIQPAYPFQCVCADFFTYRGISYLVIVDRSSNWPIIERAHNGSQGLIDRLRRTFSTYSIPDECATDGGPEFTRPILARHTSPAGSLDTDTLQRAILQYRNTPDPNTHLSPAQCLFGRPIKDFIPIIPGRCQPHPTWSNTLAHCEAALRLRHRRAEERWSEHTKRLTPLVVGDHVRLQNQNGPYPNKWDKTGTVVEVKQFDQYRIRIAGSGRLTLRNRKFLRRFVPVHQPPPPRVITQDMVPSQMQPCPSQQPLAVDRTPLPPNHQPTGPPTPVSTDDEQPPTPPSSPLPGPPATAASSPPRPAASPRVPLALRRLQDYNSKELLES
eukprot:gene15679-17260_t